MVEYGSIILNSHFIIINVYKVLESGTIKPTSVFENWIKFLPFPFVLYLNQLRWNLLSNVSYFFIHSENEN